MRFERFKFPIASMKTSVEKLIQNFRKGTRNRMQCNLKCLIQRSDYRSSIFLFHADENTNISYLLCTLSRKRKRCVRRSTMRQMISEHNNETRGNDGRDCAANKVLTRKYMREMEKVSFRCVVFAIFTWICKQDCWIHNPCFKNKSERKMNRESL